MRIYVQQSSGRGKEKDWFRHARKRERFSTTGPCTCSLAKEGLRATQQHDDTILLDLSSRPPLGPLVNLIAKTRKRDEKLFSFTIDAWRKELCAAAQRLQVRYLGITSHVMRHSRPNNDRASHCRTIEKFQKRNRWLVSTSLRRYEKTARLSLLVADLPAQALAKILEHA